MISCPLVKGVRPPYPAGLDGEKTFRSLAGEASALLLGRAIVRGSPQMLVRELVAICDGLIGRAMICTESGVACVIS